jgi:hypothetical protein
MQQENRVIIPVLCQKMGCPMVQAATFAMREVVIIKEIG